MRSDNLEPVDAVIADDMLTAYNAVVEWEERQAATRAGERTSRLDRLRRIEDLAARLVAQIRYGQGVRTKADIDATVNRLEHWLRQDR